MDICPDYQRQARRGAPNRNRFRERLFGDFDCCHCGLAVSADPLLAGVQHRNHCPHCLWSRHMDLHAAGDRLCACKGPMRPVALAFKRAHKHYAPAQPGELMLVHCCVDCGAVALNRLAADDAPNRLWDVFADSLAEPPILPGVDALGRDWWDWLRAHLDCPP